MATSQTPCFFAGRGLAGQTGNGVTGPGPCPSGPLPPFPSHLCFLRFVSKKVFYHLTVDRPVIYDGSDFL